MADESGQRHKYEPRQCDTYVSGYPQIAELSRWCSALDEEGLTPVEGGASAGNLSFRTTRGFVITATRSTLKSNIPEQGFLEVVRVEFLGGERFRVHYLGGATSPDQDGKMPSSDVPMHHLIYNARPDVNAIFHGHDYTMLRVADQLGVPVTPQETLYGTLEDARESVTSLAQHDFIIRRGHGFVAVGRTMEIAGRMALEVHRRALML